MHFFGTIYDPIVLFRYFLVLCEFGYNICVCAFVSLHFLGGSHALFTKPVSTFFSKNNFKTKSHSIIHTFKNHFFTVFSVFSNKLYPNKLFIYKTFSKNSIVLFRYFLALCEFGYNVCVCAFVSLHFLGGVPCTVHGTRKYFFQQK